MMYTFNELINLLFDEYQILANDITNLKNMLIIPETDIINIYFIVNNTEELTLVLEKNVNFLNSLKKTILKKYGVTYNINEEITINNLINKIQFKEIFLNTNIDTFKLGVNKIINNPFYLNNSHPPILINNRYGTYALSITSLSIELSGISGYLKDVHLRYDAQNNLLKLVSFGPKINTKDLAFLMNITINKNLFNSYFQKLLTTQTNYKYFTNFPEIDNERFISWDIYNQSKKLILSNKKKLK